MNIYRESRTGVIILFAARYRVVADLLING